MKITALIARILLGLIYFIFGLNFFFNFVPIPQMGKEGDVFLKSLITSGYFFQFLKIIEVAGGFFLLINRYTAFILIMVLPVSVNIFLFHTMLAPSGIPMALGILALNLFLCVAYLKYYRSVFVAKPEAGQ